MPTDRVSVVGLGKLGLPFAACWANRGFTVIGVDIDEDRVAAINEGRIGEYEPDVAEVLNASKAELVATTDIARAAAETDTTFIMVNTPGEASGKFTNRYVLSVCEQLGEALAKKQERHVVVLASSVTPGSIENEIIPALEAASGKRNGQEFDFLYSPVFIALGSMVKDYLKPDMALIGEASTAAGDQLATMLRRFYTEADVPFVRTSYVNAELIKLTLSTFITTKISYANMLAELCDNIAGADVDVVAEALGLDKRISPKVLKGGMPYGGPCFPRDNRALLYLTKQAGIDGSIVQATDSFNTSLTDSLARQVKADLAADGRVGILGLSFKPNTDVVEESASIDLANRLHADGAAVIAYDPQALDNARAGVRDGMRLAASLADCLAVSDVVVVATPWAEFSELPQLLAKIADRAITVIDPWRLFSSDDFPEHVTYKPVGRSYSRQGEPTVATGT